MIDGVCFSWDRPHGFLRLSVVMFLRWSVVLCLRWAIAWFSDDRWHGFLSDLWHGFLMWFLRWSVLLISKVTPCIGFSWSMALVSHVIGGIGFSGELCNGFSGDRWHWSGSLRHYPSGLQHWFLMKSLVVVFEFWDGPSQWFWQESTFLDERPIFFHCMSVFLFFQVVCVFCLLLPLF